MSSSLVKIGNRVLDLWLMSLLGPNCQKLISRPLTPNVTVFRSKKFFMLSTKKFFKIWMIFGKVMSVYSQEIAKKPTKNTFYGATPYM